MTEFTITCESEAERQYLLVHRLEYRANNGSLRHTRYRVDWPPEGRPVVVRREVLAPVLQQIALDNFRD